MVILPSLPFLLCERRLSIASLTPLVVDTTIFMVFSSISGNMFRREIFSSCADSSVFARLAFCTLNKSNTMNVSLIVPKLQSEKGPLSTILVKGTAFEPPDCYCILEHRTNSFYNLLCWPILGQLYVALTKQNENSSSTLYIPALFHILLSLIDGKQMM